MAMTDLHRHGIFDDTLVSALFVFQRWQIAAALSAAVTSTNRQGTALTFQAEPSRKKCATRTPAALREGARGRSFSQRSCLPRNPRITPTSLQEGAWGRALLYQRSALPRSTSYPNALIFGCAPGRRSRRVRRVAGVGAGSSGGGKPACVSKSRHCAATAALPLSRAAA